MPRGSFPGWHLVGQEPRKSWGPSACQALELRPGLSQVSGRTLCWECHDGIGQLCRRQKWGSGAEASCSLHSPRLQGTKQGSQAGRRALVPPLGSVSGYAVAYVWAESLRSWPFLAGAEGMNRVREAVILGGHWNQTTEGTRNAGLEDSGLILQQGGPSLLSGAIRQRWEPRRRELGSDGETGEEGAIPMPRRGGHQGATLRLQKAQGKHTLTVRRGHSSLPSG